jgi:hypothetical protein
MLINGVKDVVIDFEIFPREFTIYKTKLVKVKEIEDVVIKLDFHAAAKGVFEL